MNNWLFIMLIFVSALLCSCNNEPEVFSCNEELNEWTKANLATIRKMDRNDWLKITDFQKGKAVYRAFSTNQRCDFWVNKLKQVRQLEWTAAEKKHISNLISFIQEHPQILEDGYNDEENDYLSEKYIYLWEEKGQDEFGWTKQQLFAMIASGENMLDTNGQLEPIYASDAKIKQRAPGNCGCSVSSDWCNAFVWNNPNLPGGPVTAPTEPILIRYCESGGCTSVSGCGTLFRHNCDGMCQNSLIL